MKGDACEFSHVLPNSTQPATTSELRSQVSMYKCPLCHNNVLYEGKRFGILPNCSHIFCIDCIRNWRNSNSGDGHNGRCCPVCKVESYFVVPSATPIIDEESKQRLIQSYKENMSKIECSFFNRGKGVCPFGSNCFYKHTNETSGEHKPNIAINASGELVDLNNNLYNLTDFIVPSTKSKNKKNKTSRERLRK